MATSAPRYSKRSRSRRGEARDESVARPQPGTGGRPRRFLPASLRGAFRAAAGRWARRRQGADPLAVTLRRRRIYILPTRYGIVFACLVFAMLLGSQNYAASLGYVLTFLLAGLGLVTLHHCHNNLLGVEVRYAGAQPVFAGRDARFRIALANGSSVPRYELEVEAFGRSTAPVDVAPGEVRVLPLVVPTARRGWVELPRFAVATRHPGSLCRAWTWVHMDAKCLVYPEPAPPGRPSPLADDDRQDGMDVQHGDADFAGLRNAVPGDPPRQIAWKAYARSEQLLLKQFSGGPHRAEIFAWDSLTRLDTEQRLSQLTRWCLDAAAGGRRFGLRLPAATVPLGSGEKHLHACLAKLALFREFPGGAGAGIRRAAGVRPGSGKRPS